MKKRLTEISIQNIKPPTKGQVDYWDTSLPAFGVRVSYGGSKTFVAKQNGQRKVLGRYPATSLKTARAKARELLHDPEHQRQVEETNISYDEAVDKYIRIKSLELRPRTLEGYERLLCRMNFKTVVRDIRAYQIADELERILGQTNRSHAFTILKVFFGWCVTQEFCDKNPMQNLKKPRLPKSRDRVLTEDELKEIWWACDELENYGLIVQILMLTGQRKAQIAHLHEEWVHDDHFLFPGSIMKNGLEHRCPIGSLTKTTLMRALPIKGYYFSPITAVGRPFSNWSKSKKQLDEMAQIDPWCLHDLRRTWSTNAADLDIPPHITARVLSHATPEGSISAIYNRSKYKKQMADAIHKMNDHILSLISP